MLNYFGEPEAIPLHSFGIDIYHVADISQIPLAVPQDYRLVSRTEFFEGFVCSIYGDGRHIYIEIPGNAIVGIDLDRETAVGFVAERGHNTPPVFVSTYIMLPIINVYLRKYLHYLVHAGCITYGEKGIMIVGPSGSGKTTLALTLLVYGEGGFLSEDTSILNDNTSPMTVLSFPTVFNIRPGSLALFSDAIPMDRLSPHSDGEKQKLKLEEISARPFVRKCRPAMLVFPKVSGKVGHKATRLTKPQALERLLPESLSIMELTTPGGHFSALIKFTEEVTSYEIEMGTDVKSLPPFLYELLDKS